jgi:hypothetical protein
MSGSIMLGILCVRAWKWCTPGAEHDRGCCCVLHVMSKSPGPEVQHGNGWRLVFLCCELAPGDWCGVACIAKPSTELRCTEPDSLCVLADLPACNALRRCNHTGAFRDCIMPLDIQWMLSGLDALSM